ncbi:unnamed protein product [Mytilus edulis]|uniref:Uncharacterized protein n=1 Tax=Mytilus edulis TaxID=6550 RepID=A0A8S3T587_MYTED|nr:unnamed protein product [Mytilus edulis]
MTTNKLRKYIARQQPTVQGIQRRTPILLSDSKGTRLEREIQSDNSIHDKIVFKCKPGASTQQCVDWLKENFKTEIKNFGDIHLYVWAATCNLTTKHRGGSISLTSSNNSSIDLVLKLYRDIISFIEKFPSCRVTFLNIPVYSIFKYNESLKVPNPEDVIEQDHNLLHQIHILNVEINKLNRSLRVTSPDFNVNLCVNPKHTTRRGQGIASKLSYNFELYQDGIHPRYLLNTVWLHKLVLQIRFDCWFV